MGSGHNRIKVTRYQKRKPTRLAHASSRLTGLLPGTEIEIGAGRPYNGRTGVLGDHGAAEWDIRAPTGKRQIRFNEERRAIDVQRLVYGNRTTCRQRNSLSTKRLAVLSQPDDAEKHHGTVLPTHLLGFLRMGLHPLPDALHRHLFARNDIALDQHTAHRHVGIAVVSVVVDAQHGTVFEPDPRRALDLDEQRVGSAADPADFQVAAVEGAVFDFATIVVGNKFAA